MKHVLALSLMAVISWYAPEMWTTGAPIPWEAVADISYIPAVSTTPYGPWTDYPATALLWADYVPDPAPGKTLYYSCKAVMYGRTSGYAMPISITAPKRGYGKGGWK